MQKSSFADNAGYSLSTPRSVSSPARKADRSGAGNASEARSQNTSHDPPDDTPRRDQVYATEKEARVPPGHKPSTSLTRAGRSNRAREEGVKRAEPLEKSGLSAPRVMCLACHLCVRVPRVLE